MEKLKRNIMLERGCIHCQYYEKWHCKLDECNLKKEHEKEEIEKKINEPNKMFNCNGCPYSRKGVCVGFCMQQVLTECKAIWDKKRVRRDIRKEIE